MKSHNTTDPAVSVLEDLFSDLITTLIDDEKERNAVVHEAFDSYVNNVRTKIHADVPLFRQRFAKGYHALTEELNDEQNTKS